MRFSSPTLFGLFTLLTLTSAAQVENPTTTLTTTSTTTMTLTRTATRAASTTTITMSGTTAATTASTSVTTPTPSPSTFGPYSILTPSGTVTPPSSGAGGYAASTGTVASTNPTTAPSAKPSPFLGAGSTLGSNGKVAIAIAVVVMGALTA